MTAVEQDDSAPAPSVASPTSAGEDHDHAGTFEYDAASGRVRWSRAAADMYGFAVEVATVDTLLTWADGDDDTEVRECLRLMVEGRAFNCHHRRIDSAGKAHWIVTVGYPVQAAPGQVAGTRGLVLDVTTTVQSGLSEAIPDVAERRGPIEQAKGVLMATYGVTAEQAFCTLVHHSQNSNVKVRDIAGLLLAAVSDGRSGDLLATIDGVLTAVGAGVGAQGARPRRRRAKDGDVG